MLAISDEKLESAIKEARIQQKKQLKKENDELQAS